jgi:predicted dehydrogenase
VTSSERKLGIGVIGAGGIAHYAHFPNLVKNPRVNLVAVADVNVARATAAAEQYDIPYHYAGYEEVIANPEVEAVIVTSWPTAHAGPVIAAAEAGKHILCEKPIATTLEDADAMVAAAEKAGVKFTMGYQPRFGNVWPAVKRLIDEGLIGRPMLLNSIGAGPSSHGAKWFLQKQYAGGGIFMDWGIYTAFQLIYWLGPVARVYATNAIFRDQVHVRGELVTGIDVEDTMAAALTFQSGAMGTWSSAWAVKARHGTTTIDGDQGSILMRSGQDGIGLYTTQRDDPDYLMGWRQIPVSDPTVVDMHYRKIAHLVDSVLDDTPLVLTGAHGRDALELVLAAYKSAETGEAADLPLPRGEIAVIAPDAQVA